MNRLGITGLRNDSEDVDSVHEQSHYFARYLLNRDRCCLRTRFEGRTFLSAKRISTATADLSEVR